MQTPLYTNKNKIDRNGSPKTRDKNMSKKFLQNTMKCKSF